MHSIVLSKSLSHFICCLIVVLIGLSIAACEPGTDPNAQARNNVDSGNSSVDKPAIGSGAIDKPVADKSKDSDRTSTKPPISAKPALPVKPSIPAKPTSDIHTNKVYKVLQEKSDRLMVTLPNRMIVIAQEIRTAPVVSVQMWVKTGSIYEQEHVGAGLSHFLEHLLSGGSTTTRSEDENNKILGKMGARTNAATSLEKVWYYVNTTRPFASEAVALMSDWMQNNKIAAKEFGREREVIQREFQMGQGEPGRILWKLMQQARYKAHPARHPTIGYIDEFKAVTRDQVYDFYRRMYVPNNMVFVVCGDIDKQKIIDQITGLWKDQKPGELPKLSFPKEPELDSPRALTGYADVRRPRVRIAWPGTVLAGEDDYAMDLLAVILGQGESSRLVKTVRDQQRIVNSIVSYNSSFAWGKGFFAVDADIALSPKPGDDVKTLVDAAIEKANAAILTQIEKIKTAGVTPEELARAKRNTIAQVIGAAESAEDVADLIAGYTISMGDPDYLDRYAEAIKNITADQVKAAAKKYLISKKTIKLTLLPSPKKPEMLARPSDPEGIKDLPRVPIDLDNSNLIDRITKNVAASKSAERVSEVDALKHYTLSNGLRLVVGRNTRIPAVAIELFQLGGLLADEPGLEGVANATAIMQMRGTKTRTAQQIATELENLGASVGTRCGYNTAYSKASCLAEDWKKTMAIFADVTLNPSFPENEWAIMKQRLGAAIEAQNDRWDTELGLKFRATYMHQHPWQTMALGRGEIVKALTAQNLRAFHRQFLVADQAVLAVFGDVDPDQVAKEAETLFASMPATSKTPFVPPIPKFAPSGRVEFPTNKQTTAVQIGFGPGVARNHTDYAAIQVLIKVINNFPAGWLEYELRMKDRGIAYAVWAYQTTGVIPGYISFVFNCKAADLDEGVKRSLAVANRARTEVVNAETLARAQAAVLTGEFLGKQSNADRATEAALAKLYNLPADESDRFIKAVQAVTAEQLQAIAKKYLKNEVIVIIKEKDAEKGASSPAKPAKSD
jgi:zinc protease